MSNPGDNFSKTKEAATDVLVESVKIDLNQQIIDSFESWLEVHLENCVLSFDLEQVPHLDVLEGVQALHAHAEEAERQFGLAEDLQGKLFTFDDFCIFFANIYSFCLLLICLCFIFQFCLLF